MGKGFLPLENWSMGLMRKMKQIRYEDIKSKNIKDLIISLIVLFTFFIFVFIIKQRENLCLIILKLIN